MSSSTTLGLRRPVSAPGWFNLVYAGLVTIIQGYAFYDPSSTQKQLGLDAPTVRIIGSLFHLMTFTAAADTGTAFCLIAIKGYEAIGSLQDSWATYWFALIGRVAAASLMLSFGGGWAQIAPVDFGSAAVLAVCMALTPSQKTATKKR